MADTTFTTDFDPRDDDIRDFAVGAAEETGEASESYEASPDAYSNAEVAQIVASMSAFGLPLESMEGYITAYMQRTTPMLELIGMGEALDEMGINKASGAERVPAWMRVAAGGAGLGVSAILLRRQYATPSPSGGSGDGAVADDA